jgi:hypothetical protein
MDAAGSICGAAMSRIIFDGIDFGDDRIPENNSAKQRYIGDTKEAKAEYKAAHLAKKADQSARPPKAVEPPAIFAEQPAPVVEPTPAAQPEALAPEPERTAAEKATIRLLVLQACHINSQNEVMADRADRAVDRLWMEFGLDGKGRYIPATEAEAEAGRLSVAKKKVEAAVKLAANEFDDGSDIIIIKGQWDSAV